MRSLAASPGVVEHALHLPQQRRLQSEYQHGWPVPLAGMDPGHFGVRRADQSECVGNLPLQLVSDCDIEQQLTAVATYDPVRQDSGI